MKKIVVFVLLTGVALGASSLDGAIASSTGDSITWDSSVGDFTNFTLTCKLDGNALSKALVDIAKTNDVSSFVNIALLSLTANGNKIYVGSQIGDFTTTNQTDSTILATYGTSVDSMLGFKQYSWADSNSNPVSILSTQLDNWGYEEETNSSKISSAAYTITGTAGSEFTSYLTVQLYDGTSYTYSGTSAGLQFGNTTRINSVVLNEDIVDAAYMFDSLTDASDAWKLNHAVAAIPEPTTATLSLLALAGLAARRRRH